MHVQLFPWWLYQFTLPATVQQNCSVPHTFANNWVFSVFNFSHFVVGILVLYCDFNLHFLFNDVVSICILTTQISIYFKCLSVFLNLNWDVSPLTGLQQFFYLCYTHTPYICITAIFSQSVAYFFIPLVLSFDEQTFLILMKQGLSVFYVISALCV